MTDGMIDCHCHILPGIDDGASDIEESVAMAKIAFADGISRIVATPHVSDARISPGDIIKRVEELNRHLIESQVPVRIYPAAEVSISLDLLLFAKYTVNHTKYVLVELPPDFFPPFTPNLMSWLLNEGLHPIIAHPERNTSIVGNPDRLFELLNDGILVQITAGSLTGEFGVDSQICAERLLDSGNVHIIASDAHSSDFRQPILSKGVEAAAKRIGAEHAKRLAIDNPAAILEGRAVG